MNDNRNKICVITDNEFIYYNFLNIIEKHKLNIRDFDFFTSKKNEIKNMNSNQYLPSVSLKKSSLEDFRQYYLIISAHCKQIFPNYLVENIRCINIHPGFNPFNRGWFPQVFSIINKKPIGATIHEIDTELDHGAIIAQEKVDIDKFDTSYDVYKKVQNKEIELLDKNLIKILENKYETKIPSSNGNINLKKDFDLLCELDMSKVQSVSETIDLLRALTFDGYKNAYFYDDDGSKIFVSIKLEKEMQE